MAVEIIPSDPGPGAELRGFDPAAPVGAEDRAALLRAWRQHLVLVIRGYRLSDPELLAFSRVFGTPDPPGPNPYGGAFLPDYPDINVISNVVEDGRPIGTLGAGEAVWHADMTYVEQPPKAAVLHALELPETGGDTYFADMFAAYEGLPEALRKAIRGRLAIHDSTHNSAGMRRLGAQEVADVRKSPGARHPLVRTDPDTGRRALFLGRRPHAYIVGLEVAESEALLDQLWAHATQPRFTMVHHWRIADTLIWNNLAVLHRRDPFADTARRILHRTQIRGDAPVA